MKAGFEPMAVQLVKQVKAAEKGVRAPMASTFRGAVAASVAAAEVRACVY